MRTARTLVLVTLLLAGTNATQAGLYYSGESFAELPSQWRGFLLDQRALRNIALKPVGVLRATPERTRYKDALAKLEKTARERPLTATELADQGALYVRLAEIGKAVEVLRAAQRIHPQSFPITANLGAAYHFQGDLEQAAGTLQSAVRLAPPKLRKVEEYHLKLVRLRQRQPRDGQDLDDLLGVRYVGEKDKYEPGVLAAAQRKKLPENAVAIVQQLALWLPADGRLLWQLAELAGAYGDVRTAAAIMDGCVTEFNMRSGKLLEHRRLCRAAADALVKNATGRTKIAHEGHAGTLQLRSPRPLINKIDPATLPVIRDRGMNTLPWAVLGETTVDQNFKPTFSAYLQKLDGKQVTLSGFMQPIGDDLEAASFMLIEYPVGCWYCEMPAMTGMVLVELPANKTVRMNRNLIKVVGKLSLNKSDPEGFLFSISHAKVAEAD